MLQFAVLTVICTGCVLVILTGSAVADQIFQVLLKTSMFVGGVTGFILDNTVPGRKYFTNARNCFANDRFPSARI